MGQRQIKRQRKFVKMVARASADYQEVLKGAAKIAKKPWWKRWFGL